MNRTTLHRLALLSFTLLLIMAFAGAALADGPVDGRTGRAEIRFLEGMIDHHQMALDMANQCVERASTEEVQAVCAAVIAAQSPEIEQMQAWLRDWYGIDYQPIAMGTGSGQHGPNTAAPAGGMMYGGMGMMGEGSMSGMMDMMQGMMSGGSMVGMMDEHMPMHMMQMMMGHMNSHGMHGMGMNGQGSMGGVHGMFGMPGMMDENQMPGMGMLGPNSMPGMNAMPEGTMPGMNMGMGGALLTDPAMTMGMFAGLDRLTGANYDIAWLEAMIEHHDGAIRMSERIKMMAGGHAEVQALADTIVSAQTAEIAQMEAVIEQIGA